jgi:ligand-binding sensor protein
MIPITRRDVLAEPSPAAFTAPLVMQVERQGALTPGQLVYGNDIYTVNPTLQPDVDICVQASSALFKQFVFDSISNT